MKKLIALLLCLVMALSLVACGSKQDDTQAPADDQQGAEETSLVDAAKAEGKLVVYGSCEEEYLAAACENFEKMYGIEVEYQRLSTGEVQAKIEEENGNPSADVWFGGTTDPYNICAAKGLLDPYDAVNASHLVGDMYKDADNNWFGIYTGMLGIMYNKDELERKGLDAPKDFADLTDDEAFWRGCEGCINVDVLKRTGRKYCICTAMLFDPEEHLPIKLPQEVIERIRKIDGPSAEI